MKFSLERKYKVLGAVGQIAVLVITVAAGVFVSVTSWWAGLILFGIAAIAGWTLIRVPRISVQYDIDALTSLIREDATQSMPPFDLWLHGRDDIFTWWFGPGIGCRGSRPASGR